MPRKRTTSSGRHATLKQTSLFDFSTAPKSPATSAARRRVRAPFSQGTPFPSRTRKRRNSSSNDSEDGYSSDNIKAIRLEAKDVSDSEGDMSSATTGKGPEDEDAVLPSPKKRTTGVCVGSENEELSDTQPRKLRRLRRGSAPNRGTNQDQHGSDESAGEERPSPKRRRLTKRERADSPEPERLSCDPEGDTDDLDANCILDSRLRQRGKKTAFQRNLEKLKKRKQKQPADLSDHIESDEEEDSEESELGSPKPFKGSRPSDGRSNHSGTSDEEDESDLESSFIVEDNPLAAPLLPAQFSMESHQDLSHQFKKIFQFFVHVAIQPPRKRKRFMEKNLEDEEYFSVPLMIARRKLSGLRDSLVASSVWRPEFKKALEKFPDYELTILDFTVYGCDACHLGSRRSTRCGRLSGAPYDRCGFQPLNDSDSDSSDDDDETGVEFNLGRFCARRSRVFHEFAHWEYNLFQTISQKIGEMRLVEAEQDGEKTLWVASGSEEFPEDLTDADELCQWLDDRNFIENEWQRLKSMMDSARDLEFQHKNDDE